MKTCQDLAAELNLKVAMVSGDVTRNTLPTKQLQRHPDQFRTTGTRPR